MDRAVSLVTVRAPTTPTAMDRSSRTIIIKQPDESRKSYLTSLRLLSDCPNWTKARIGVLQSEVSGAGEHWTAESRADGAGLQTQNESSAAAARTKAIGSLRAWVVRNIQDEASRRKQNSMEPTKAEQRALVLFHPQFNPERRLVRYRGGAWAMPGLRTEGPGELPVFPNGVGHTGIAVLRKLSLKQMVRLDEEKGVVTLNN